MSTITSPTISTKGKWAIDHIHSNLHFTVQHLVISHVTGTFSNYEGSISNASEDFTQSNVSFKIDVSSLDTKNEMRDGHLKSDDFFNAEAFPSIEFQSDRIVQKAENKFDIHGKLLIRDIELDVIFNALIGGTAVDGYGNTKMGMKVTTSINRFDYKLKWNQMTEAGSMVVGKTIEINAQLQFGLE